MLNMYDDDNNNNDNNNKDNNYYEFHCYFRLPV